MATRTSRICGCGKTNKAGEVCPRCEKKKTESFKKWKADLDKNRGTAGKRGYNYRWQKYSRAFLRDNPLCAECRRAGKITRSEHTDHIQRVTGPDDPLFWDHDNHQPLCRDCHSLKTAKEKS